MKLTDLKKHCKLCEESRLLLKNAVNQLHLSTRGFHRILKLGCTIAELENVKHIKSSHIAEALQHRPKEKLNVSFC